MPLIQHARVSALLSKLSHGVETPPSNQAHVAVSTYAQHEHKAQYY